MKLSKEAKVGLLVVIATTILYTGFNFLKGKDYFSSSNHYFIKYSNVDGLTKSNSITLNGFAIGRVDNIELMQNAGDSLLVTISLDGEVILQKGTVAMLVDDGLLGGKKINLVLGKSGGVIPHKGFIPGVKEGGFAATLGAIATPVIENLEDMTMNMNKILGDSSERGLRNSLYALNQTIKDVNILTKETTGLIKQNKPTINRVLTTLDSTMITFERTMRSLEPMMASMERFADSLNNMDLKATVAEAKETMASFHKIADDINAGKGNIGKLMKDEEMYNNLNMAMQRLNLMLYNFDTDPKQFLAPLGQNQKKIMKKRQDNSKVAPYYGEFK